MAEPDKKPVTLEELLVSSLAQTVFSVWLRFAALLLAVVAIGCVRLTFTG